MADKTLRGKWQEFREDFDKRLHGEFQAPGEPRTRFEKDYGPDGEYRLPQHKVDKSTGSETLDD